MLIHKLDDDTDSNNEDEYDNLCLVCYENIKEGDENAILKCGHKYHYKCIILVFKSALQKSVVAAKQCPYCRITSDYLPLKPGIQPIKFIHKEYKAGNNDLIQYIPGKCKYILKRGPNSGHQCSNGAKTDDGYCKKHQKLLDAKKIKNEENKNGKKPEMELSQETTDYINQLYESILGTSSN